MVEDVWVQGASGIQLVVDPEQVIDGQVADALNIDWARPFGTCGPRAGSVSLVRHDAAVIGGHPSQPIGSGLFDGSDQVVRLVYDEVQRRLWAIFRAGQDEFGDDLAAAAVLDLQLSGTGFDLAAKSEPFRLDGRLIPGVEVIDGRLFVATGARHQHGNVVIDPAGMQLLTTRTDPEVPPIPGVSLETPDEGVLGLTALVGYRYRIVYKSSRTLARSAYSEAEETGEIASRKQVRLTLSGAADAAVYDRIEVYRTTDGGDVFRRLTEISNPGAGQTAELVDSTTDDLLSYQIMPRRHGRPPSCRYLVNHADRLLYGCKTDHPFDGSVVYYSEPFAPFNVDPVVNVITVGRHDGATIVGMFRLINRVFVVKSNGSIWELADNRPESVYRAVPLINEGPWACVSAATIVEIEGAAYWLAARGVVRFTGESIELISLPIEPLLLDVELAPGQVLSTAPAQTRGPASLLTSFTNDDFVPESFHFELGFYASSENDPNDDDTGLVLELRSADHPQYFTAAGQAIAAGGKSIAPGQSTALRIRPPAEALTDGSTYYPWVRAWDGTQFSGWCALPAYTAGLEADAEDTTTSWGRIARFFAVHYPPREEYWLFVATKGAAQIDTRLALHYRSIGQAGGPSWRRDAIHATAATWVDSLALSVEEPNIDAVVSADAMGCAWVHLETERIDHRVDVAEPLTDAQRNGTGVLAGTTIERDAYDEPSVEWPHNGLRGQRLAVRDADGGLHTGVIAANTTRSLTLSFWLGGAGPADGEAVAFGIGGVACSIEWYPMDFGEQGLAKQVRYLLLRGLGDEEPIAAELRFSDLAERPLPGALARARQISLTASIGVTQRRIPVQGRGLVCGLRLASFAAGSAWRLSAWGLGIIRSRSRN